MLWRCNYPPSHADIAILTDGNPKTFSLPHVLHYLCSDSDVFVFPDVNLFLAALPLRYRHVYKRKLPSTVPRSKRVRSVARTARECSASSESPSYFTWARTYRTL